MKLRLIAVCLLGIILFAGKTTAQERKSGTQSSLSVEQKFYPTPNQPYPDFVLPTIDGNESLQLSDYRGTKVLLIHFASW